MDTRKALKFFPFLMVLMLLVPVVGASPSYRKLLNQHTRKDRVYELRNFEPRIVWHATHLTPKLVEAQLDRLAKELHWSDAERARELANRLTNDEFSLSPCAALAR